LPSDTNATLAQFQTEIAYFQNNTDGLVVDEMRNNGGSLCYGESIVANLIPTIFRPLGYQIRATYEYLQVFGGRLASALAGNNQTVIDQYKSIYNAIQTSYEGSQRLTDAVPLCTPNFDHPPDSDSNGNVIAYKKPLIMLIDEFSVSTADSVPAMIRDNARGLLVGWRTNGMGGSNSVSTSRYQVPYSESDTGVTLALMVRKAPIATADYPLTSYTENVGVRPDVERSIT
jgi:C-terminal processing protease CtpA/Prc